MSGLDGLGWPTDGSGQDADAVKSWGPLVIADVVGGDLAENTVTLRIHGPMPHTILGAQWFLFHNAPPAAERLPFPFLHNAGSMARELAAHDSESTTDLNG